MRAVTVHTAPTAWNPSGSSTPTLGHEPGRRLPPTAITTALFLAIVTAIFSLACGQSSQLEPTPNRVKHTVRTAEAFASINIAVSKPPRIALVAPIPGLVSLRPGQTTRLSAVGFDQLGQEIDDLTFRWRVVDSSAGTISPTGIFQAGTDDGFYPGALAVRATPPAGFGAGASEGFVDVAIVTEARDKAPASIQLFPRVAVAAPAQPLYLSALGLDAGGSLLPGGQPSWEMADDRAGTIGPNGRFVAGQSAGFYPEAILVTLPDDRGGGITAFMDVRVLDDVQLLPSIGLNILPRALTVGPGNEVGFEAVALVFQTGQRLTSVSVIWTMLDPSAGTISDEGLFRASRAPGIYPDAVEASIILPGQDGVSGGNLTARATISIVDTVSSQPGVRVRARVDIYPDQITLSPGESTRIGIVGFDAEGKPLSILDVQWTLDPRLGEVVSFTEVKAGSAPGNYPRAIQAAVNVETSDGPMTYRLSADLIIRGPLETIIIEPESLTLQPGERGIFRALSTDATDNILSDVVYRWSVLNEAAGSIDVNGSFTAGEVPGQYGNAIRVEGIQINGPTVTKLVATVPPSPTPTPVASPTSASSPKTTPTATSIPTATPTVVPTLIATVPPSPTPTPVASPTPASSPKPAPTATSIPTATPTVVPTLIATVPPSPTPEPTPTPASSPTPASMPTPTPTLLEGPTLSINGILVEPGQRTVSLANGSVTLSLAPGPGGGYPLNASLSLIANLDFPGFPIMWAAVDSQEGALATVRMDVNRYVVLILGAPAPTPKPQQAVGGVLSSARWTADFDYVVTEDLEIATGSFLYIDPGTVVRFADGTKLEVNGTLNATGTSSQPIVFTSDSKWGGIQILNSETNSVISYGVIERVAGTALDINDGTLKLDNTVVRHSTQGIWVRSNQANMFRNEIHSNETGVVTGGSNSVNLRNSTIRDNNVGIRVVGPAGQVFFKQNNITNNVEFDLLVVGVGGKSIDASGSWWGTTDKALIARRIHDQKDDSLLSAVVFEPIAVERIATAP